MIPLNESYLKIANKKEFGGSKLDSKTYDNIAQHNLWINRKILLGLYNSVIVIKRYIIKYYLFLKLFRLFLDIF